MQNPRGKNELEELLENNQHTLMTKAELFEHNPLLHASLHPQADNENIISQSEVKTTPSMLRGESQEFSNNIVETIQEFEDSLGNLFATQRYITKLWMQSWVSLWTPQFFAFNLLSNE